MLRPFSLLVSVDKRGTYELTLPWVSQRQFHGRSPSRLYDDAALHLMERVFEAGQAELPSYLYCPESHHRKLKVKVLFRDEQAWRGRLSVVLRRWPKDEFYEACVPRLGPRRFAIARLSDLPGALAQALREWGGKDSAPLRGRLDGSLARGHEYLDLLEVDLDLPTALPKTARRRRPRVRQGVDLDAIARVKRRRETPPTTLRQVGVNLLHRVLDGSAANTIARDAVVTRVKRRIERPGACVLLVGPAGSGKSAIIEAVVRAMAEQESRLHARRDAWLVDANRIISGMSYVGQWEARVDSMIDELSAREDVLVVDDLPALVHAGRTSQEETNVASFLEPAITQGQLRILGECTAERLEAVRDEDPGFFAHFHVVPVAPLGETESLRVLVQRVREIELRGFLAGGDARTKVMPDVPETILGLTRRFSFGRALPGQAVSLLEGLAAESPSTRRDDSGRLVLDRESLVGLFSAQTGLPRFALWEADSQPHREIRAHFGRRIIAQPAAAEAVAEVVTTLQQGLNDPTKPIASFLLVGPTGVGKTETAKALAEYLFGSAERLLRFDMSELSDAYSASRLFGDARQPDGELTRRVRQQPFSVVLFDEIEKAHPSIFDALLQVLGEGRLTSADGRTTGFCNTVVLMTSNLGVKEAESLVGFGGERPPDRSAHFVGAARAFFRPEFFNRIDRIVPFAAFDRSAVRPLVDRAIVELMGRRGLRRAGVLVDVEDELIDVLVELGFDSRYGARPLRRAVERELAVPLARKLVLGKPEDTTLVSLFREGEGIGMDVWPLAYGGAPAEAAPTRLETFDELAELHGEAMTWLEAARPRVDAVQRQGLALYNAGDMPDEGWPRFDMASGLAARLVELERGLEHFASQVLDGRDFRMRVELVTDHEVQWAGTGRGRAEREFISEEPVSPGGRPPPARVAELDRLRVDLVESLHRAEGLDDEPSDTLLRVLPATNDPLSRHLAYATTLALRAVVQPWGEVRRYRRRQAGGWVELPLEQGELDHEPALQREQQRWTDTGGWALQVRGFRVEELVAEELGFHLETHYSGADLHAALVRVESVGDDRPALERLEELDRGHAHFLRERSLGRVADNPRGALPLCRRYAKGRALDARTGLLQTRTFTDDLVASRRQRLLRRHQEKPS